MNKLSAINAKIERLGNAERITKSLLAELSRDLLGYVMVDAMHDIAAVNRTINVLTPMNKKTAILFFSTFTSHKFNDTTQAFGGKDKKQHDDKLAACVAFLSDESNTIWTWAEENVKLEPKPKDYFGQLTKLIERALADEAEGLQSVDIVNALLSAGIEQATIELVLAEKRVTEQAAAATVAEIDAVLDAQAA